MPKGTHLSKERKQLIFSHFNAGETPEECHDGIFLGCNSVCTLKHIHIWLEANQIFIPSFFILISNF